MPNRGNPRVHFIAGQFAALARLGTLRHFDLQFFGIDQIIAGDAKASRSHLFDGAVFGIAIGFEGITRRILPSFAGIAFATETIHCYGECFVRFFGYRSVGHGTRFKASGNRFDGFNFVDRNGFVGTVEVQETAQGRQVFGLLIDEGSVFFVHVVVVGARGVLELVNRKRIKEVIFPALPPLKMSADVEGTAID